jgi:hypothetical protein
MVGVVWWNALSRPHQPPAAATNVELWKKYKLMPGYSGKYRRSSKLPSSAPRDCSPTVFNISEEVLWRFACGVMIVERPSSAAPAIQALTIKS